jgi:hypothetical protein
MARSKDEQWLCRGQNNDWPLLTAIERALVGWRLSLQDASVVEFQVIREFRRRAREPQYRAVETDTLYCLSLMQNHGAPTRLLDCTYSPFVAAAFAIENGIFSSTGDPLYPVIWCFNAHWCTNEAKKALPVSERALIDLRNEDAWRNDQTFVPLFQIKTDKTAPLSKWKFVKVENSFYLNERLTAQQGAFLCPADIRSSFECNLKAMDGWKKAANLKKLYLKLDKEQATRFARNLKDMNISFAALFPGLDGFAKSLNQQICHYDQLGKGKSGHG